MKKISALILSAVLFGACSGPRSGRGEGPIFPQLAPAASERAYPSAFADGTLVLEGECLRLQEGGYLILWPPHVRLSRSGKALQVIDRQSALTARVGERVRLSGGEIQAGAPILRELREPLPDECAGPYWLASGIVSREG